MEKPILLVIRWVKKKQMSNDLKQYCWWDTKKREIAEYMDKYLTCQKVKAKHQRLVAYKLGLPTELEYVHSIFFTFHSLENMSQIQIILL